MIEVLGHRLLIKTEVMEDSESIQTKALAEKAGIALPEAVGKELDEQAKRDQAGMDRGIVIQIGSTAFKDFGTDHWCVVGDDVAFAKYSGKWVKDPETDEEFLIINDEDLVCRFKKAA